MKYLMIVEGEKTEHKIFGSVLSRYGFSVTHLERPRTFSGYTFSLDETIVEDEHNTVYIMQAPKNRIGEFIDTCIRENWDLHNAFMQDQSLFNGIFIVFDVDHTTSKDLNTMMNRFSDEFDEGLLLVSSPCIEILSEPNRIEKLEVSHLKAYKKERNLKLQNNPDIKKDAIDYIINNFEDIMISFIDKNTNYFNQNNIMEHLALVVDEINRKNKRDKEYVCYTYFTTVVYVVFACLMGLTKDIDNVEAVKAFFSRVKEYANPSNSKE